MTMKCNVFHGMPVIKNNCHIFWKYLKIFICLSLIQVSEGTAQSAGIPNFYFIDTKFGSIHILYKDKKYFIPNLNGKNDIFISSGDQKFIEEFTKDASRYGINVTKNNENQNIKVLALHNLIDNGIVNQALKRDNIDFMEVFELISSQKLNIPCYADAVLNEKFNINTIKLLIDLKDREWARRCSVIFLLNINGITFSSKSKIDYEYLYDNGPLVVKYVNNCMNETSPVDCLKYYQ